MAPLTFKTFLPGLAMAASCCGMAAACRPVIEGAWPTSGHTPNKATAADLVYLVRPGDAITFSVTAEAPGRHEWQVNKPVQEGVVGS